jgi:hypothetical protein
MGTPPHLNRSDILSEPNAPQAPRVAQPAKTTLFAGGRCSMSAEIAGAISAY